MEDTNYNNERYIHRRKFSLALIICVTLVAASLGAAIFFYIQNDCELSDERLNEIRIDRDSLIKSIKKTNMEFQRVSERFDSLSVLYDSLQNETRQNQLKLDKQRKKLKRHEKLFDSFNVATIDSITSEYFRRTGHPEVFYITTKQAINFRRD